MRSKLSRRQVLAGVLGLTLTASLGPIRPAYALSPGLPVRLRIPVIDVDAPVEYVGLTADGAMDTPKDYGAVGWYQLGYRPGQRGNAVVTGHVDSRLGYYAVFSRLAEINVNDTVEVHDHLDQIFYFNVVGGTVYPADEAPILDLFGPASLPLLRLVTCTGRFDRTAGQYDQRLVLTAQLIEE